MLKMNATTVIKAVFKHLEAYDVLKKIGLEEDFQHGLMCEVMESLAPQHKLCQGITAKGVRCSRKAKKDGDCCYQHEQQVKQAPADEEEPAAGPHCKIFVKTGEVCLEEGEELLNGFCMTHYKQLEIEGEKQIWGRDFNPTAYDDEEVLRSRIQFTKDLYNRRHQPDLLTTEEIVADEPEEVVEPEFDHLNTFTEETMQGTFHQIVMETYGEEETEEKEKATTMVLMYNQVEFIEKEIRDKMEMEPEVYDDLIGYEKACKKLDRIMSMIVHYFTKLYNKRCLDWNKALDRIQRRVVRYNLRYSPVVLRMFTKSYCVRKQWKSAAAQLNLEYLRLVDKLARVCRFSACQH
ncbi:MAG: hypothetical protein EXX96DRAFT_624936 [Benjaminiella poitrasii]|nr:MAG: hypothetical protein EXX96DRAFT_624936 [Benjaminiella poitrasii]